MNDVLVFVLGMGGGLFYYFVDNLYFGILWLEYVYGSILISIFGIVNSLFLMLFFSDLFVYFMDEFDLFLDEFLK